MSRDCPFCPTRKEQHCIILHPRLGWLISHLSTPQANLSAGNGGFHPKTMPCDGSVCGWLSTVTVPCHPHWCFSMCFAQLFIDIGDNPQFLHMFCLKNCGFHYVSFLFSQETSFNRQTYHAMSSIEFSLKHQIIIKIKYCFPLYKHTLKASVLDT